mmetsp:Transcript_15114/g.31164  ORF Transcript_15114/g.31164 Transcript_15114/m.31164 type:complete len:228 (-) Transcript_15114:81-764(-)
MSRYSHVVCLCSSCIISTSLTTTALSFLPLNCFLFLLTAQTPPFLSLTLKTSDCVPMPRSPILEKCVKNVMSSSSESSHPSNSLSSTLMVETLDLPTSLSSRVPHAGILTRRFFMGLFLFSSCSPFPSPFPSFHTGVRTGVGGHIIGLSTPLPPTSSSFLFLIPPSVSNPVSNADMSGMGLKTPPFPLLALVSVGVLPGVSLSKLLSFPSLPSDFKPWKPPCRGVPS